MKKILFLILSCLWLTSWWMKNQLPEKPGDFAELLKEPIQQKTQKQPFMVEAGGERYRITPKYDYELWGMVVSYHHSDSWMDRVHERWADNINIKDLCVIWGESNTTPIVYRNIDFSSGQWTCYIKTDNYAAYHGFDLTKLSNNHVLTDDPAIADTIREANYGDIIHFKGYLSHYEGRKVSRGTSTSRTDTGNGACETIYITDFSILHDANKRWDNLFSISSYLLLALIIWVLVFESIPIVKDLIRAHKESRDQ